MPHSRWLLCFALVLVGCDDGTADPDGAVASTDAGPGGVDAGDVPPSDAGGAGACGAAPSIAVGEWVERTIDVGGVARTWFVRLPLGYDPTRRYPVVYQFHGCSDRPDRESNNVPVERESASSAIHVRGRAVESCWDTSPDGPDVALFDALVAEVEATWCTNPERRFATGYSSGSFMTHQLACIRGDVLRAVATIAGGQRGSSCAGDVAALLIHDRNDGTVNISASEGARDGYLERNHCATTRSPSMPSPCEVYDGCDEGLDVAWCETSGMDHARQDDLAAPAFWIFLAQF